MPEHPLKTYREATGITIDTLARSVGVAKATISRIENDQADPSMELLRRLVEKTGLSADDFLRRPSQAQSADAA